MTTFQEIEPSLGTSTGTVTWRTEIFPESFLIRNSTYISSPPHNMLAPQSSFLHSKKSLSEFFGPKILIRFIDQYSEQRIKSLSKLTMLWLGNQCDLKSSRTVVPQITQWLVRFQATLGVRVIFTAGNATLVDVICTRRPMTFTTVYLWYDTCITLAFYGTLIFASLVRPTPRKRLLPKSKHKLSCPVSALQLMSRNGKPHQAWKTPTLNIGLSNS